MALVVVHPAVVQVNVLWIVGEQPYCVFTEQLHHPGDNGFALRARGQHAHVAKQRIVLFRRVVGVVGAVAFADQRALRAEQQEQEVLRVGIVRQPAVGEDLGIAGKQFFPGAVPVRRPVFHLHPDTGEGAVDPVHVGVGNRLTLDINEDLQGLAGAGVPAVGIARFHQQLPRVFNRLALRFAVHPVIDVGIHPCLAFDKPGNAGWYRHVGGNTVALVENVQVFLGIKSDLQRPAQLALLLAVAAHYRVAHVEAIVVEGRLHIR